MKVSGKLFILFIAAFFTSIFLLLTLRFYDIKQRTVLLESQKTSYESIVKNVLQLKSEKYTSAVDDYSGWDDMVEYTKTRSKEFADGNLNTVVTTFRVDYVWVYDDGENLLHYSRNNESKDIPSLKNHVKISPIFSEKGITNFFIIIDGNLVQVFGGTIVPTSDFKTHYVKSSGYYLVGKVWNKDYIGEIERATDSKINFVPINEYSEPNENKTETRLSRNLLDQNGKEILKVHFTKSNQYLQDFDEISLFSLLFSSAVWLVALFVFVGFSRKWITTPLNSIEMALLKNESRFLRITRKAKNEFGDIAVLIEKYFAMNRDLNDEINNRKIAEEKLLENRKELAAVLNAINDTIVMLDRDLNVVSYNDSFKKFTGKSDAEIIGKPIVDFTSEAQKKMLDDKIKACKENGKEITFELKSAGAYWKVSIYPVFDDEGNASRFVIFNRDITDFKKTELVLRHAEEKAKEMSKLKSSFLGNMSHELRTPMVGILGFAEILGERVAGAEEKQMADMINQSGKRLMKTLDMILDLTRIEAGKFSVNISRTEISTVVFDVYMSFKRQASAKGLAMDFSKSEKFIWADTDSTLVWQIMNNLISNAVKYTLEGKVSVSINTEDSGGNKQAVITVSDTGIGIPEESLMLVFEEFRQVSEGFSRKFEGTGLGLTITKKFVEKLGGTISVESSSGVGTTFKVKFPIAEGNIVAPDKKTDINVESYFEHAGKTRILCVDDDSMTRDFVDAILSKDYKVDFTDNGVKALELAAEKKYNLILMDINLGSGINGMEVTQKIRKIQGYLKVPVVAMTAFAMNGDDEEFMNAGLDAYISKPFDIKSFKSLIGSLLKKSAP